MRKSKGSCVLLRAEYMIMYFVFLRLNKVSPSELFLVLDILVEVTVLFLTAGYLSSIGLPCNTSLDNIKYNKHKPRSVSVNRLCLLMPVLSQFSTVLAVTVLQKE